MSYPSIYNLSNDTRTFVATCNTASAESRKVIEYAIARAVAFRQKMPKAPIPNPNEFFINNVLIEADKTLSVINEIVVFDVQQVKALVREIWMMRYSVLYPREKIFCNNECPIQVVASYMGYGNYTNEAFFKTIADNKDTIIKYVNAFNTMVDEVHNEKEDEENVDD